MESAEDALLQMGAAALRKAAINAQAKDFLLNHKELFYLVKKAADRYIGGETLKETVQKAGEQNRLGFKCSIEYMGENASSPQEASAAMEEFVRICHTIRAQGLHSTVSLDLSHIGLGISRQLCLEHLDQICTAAQSDIEVIISAEDCGKTEDVLATYMEAARLHPQLAITLQAYLHRTADDFQTLLTYPGRIRVVKGAFDTPEGLSLPRGQRLNELYLQYIDTLLSTGHDCSIATHDLHIQTEARKLIDLYQPSHAQYEFESLYGIQTERLLSLKADGYMTKLYLVYGKEWYLYLCNRIAEHPVNLFQALADIVA
ncbi:hypothetical protein GCM10011379_16110 [Filimonas zeae]|uniref:proline dehydrogenase n=1 Tax=Filimonas zeae TaxID=1737353 RepID=A0A917IWS9_9BACT|nr:proline dehydrogenase family protein [Filimonas zeae]GGH64260.1 hypothetical protein GCM10011379_16110 [Filimonas zeae]